MKEWRELLKGDDEQAKLDPGRRVIYKLWPDFKVKALVDRSVATVKADAASKSYSATGTGVTWAVIDSGIEGTHPHFGTCKNPVNSAIYHREVKEFHYDFVDDGKKSAPVTRPASQRDRDDAKAERRRASAALGKPRCETGSGMGRTWLGLSRVGFPKGDR